MAGRVLLINASAFVNRTECLQIRGYAKKPVVKGKGLVKDVQKGLELCKDPFILATHAVGINIYKAGSAVQLKDDSQYPEWLFHLDVGPPQSLEEQSPGTSGYWKLLRKLHMWRNNRLARAQKL